ncbi:MAG: alpha-L-fucosidase [Cellulophaga sp.]
MKKLILLPVILFVLVSCKEEKGSLFRIANTIEITSDINDSIILKAAHVIPTQNQYEALKDEFIAFIHFGPNTFTRMEWGNGMEDPKLFNLQNLDTDQWCSVMKEAGMKKVIITVKHHDGFVLWQSRYTSHGVMSSPFKEGKGDILKELTASCAKYGLKLGVYLSPADLFQIESPTGLYGNLSKYTERTIPRKIEGRPFENKTTFNFMVDDYNEYFLNQLFELLTEYGPVDEVWFDGAHPKRKGGQTYNYLAWKELISVLAPKAVIFGKQDIRWCGNESGKTRDTEWNVIPYSDDPQEMSGFPDLMGESIGSRTELLEGKYLHYQQAETNTSIREGWFYRDDTDQKVRNADDVFDIYERSVGGNSTFLLNIPPNREGAFSATDVSVLQEVGKRIKETYGKNLFKDTKGANNALDNDMLSYELLSKEKKELIISTDEPITINRFVIQEAITTHSERIEKHAVDAWVDNAWKEIVTATNVGYKRILRFSEVTSNKFRIRVLESRFYPAISNITAHYYNTRPPQLTISRNLEGILEIAPKKHDFGWKPHGEDSTENLNSGYQIRYTAEGSTPTKESKLYTTGVLIPSGEVKAVAIDKEELGAVAEVTFGIIKSTWRPFGADSFLKDNKEKFAFDANKDTYWMSKAKAGSHYITIDLGKNYTLKGFGYTPPKDNVDGMIEKGTISFSDDAVKWGKTIDFEFGNLINDPSPRKKYFKEAIQSRYARITSKVIAGGKKAAAIAEIDFFE